MLANHPENLSEESRAWLDQIDGYEGYNAVCLEPGIKALGCWAHARRKFDEALKAQGKAHQDTPAKTGRAHQGLTYMQQLYRIEQEVKGNAAEVRYHVRQQKAKPLLDEIRTWLDAALPEVPPTSATGKALHYLHHQWHRLVRYLEDGRLQIDNNRIENAIRLFVLGRKDWLFCDTVRGAKASANLYSLIETAKANGLEPYHYLRHVFTELPKASTVEQIEKLLPHNLKPNELLTRADTPDCPSPMVKSAEVEVAKLTDWRGLYQAYRRYRACDDGTMAPLPSRRVD